MLEENKIGQEEPLSRPNRDNWRPSRQAPHQGRNWFWQVSVGILVICCLLWAWVKVMGPNHFPIRSVKISGDYTKVDREALRRTILSYANSGFWKIDTAGLQGSLAQLPWVYSAQVRRVWPDGLTISITEQQAIARYGDEMLLNSQGDLFKVAQATIPAKLPQFGGPVGQQKAVLNTYQQMMEILSPLGLTVTQLNLDPRQSWQLTLSNGITLLLGRIDPLIRLQRFVLAYRQVIAVKADDVNAVDLRYTSGMAVSFKNKNTPT